MAERKGLAEQSKKKPSKILKLSVAVLLPTLAALGVVACKTGETEEFSPTPSTSTELPKGIDPLVDCPPDTTLATPTEKSEFWPDLLGVDFDGLDVPLELENLINEEELCFFTYVPVNNKDTHHILWLPDPGKLQEIKIKLDDLVESEKIQSANFVGIDR